MLNPAAFESWLKQCLTRLRQYEHNIEFRNDRNDNDVDIIYRKLLTCGCLNSKLTLNEALLLLKNHQKDSLHNKIAYDMFKQMVEQYKHLVTEVAASYFDNLKRNGQEKCIDDWFKTITIENVLTNDLYVKWVDVPSLHEQRKWYRLQRLFVNATTNITSFAGLKQIETDEILEQLPCASLFEPETQAIIKYLNQRLKNEQLIETLTSKTKEIELNYKKPLIEVLNKTKQKPEFKLWKLPNLKNDLTISNKMIEWLLQKHSFITNNSHQIVSEHCSNELKMLEDSYNTRLAANERFQKDLQQYLENQIQYNYSKYTLDLLNQLKNTLSKGDESLIEIKQLNNDIENQIITTNRNHNQFKNILEASISNQNQIEKRYNNCIERDLMRFKITCLLELKTTLKQYNRRGILSSFSTKWRQQCLNIFNERLQIWNESKENIQFRECEAFTELLKNLKKELNSVEELTSNTAHNIFERYQHQLEQIIKIYTNNILKMYFEIEQLNKLKYTTKFSFELPITWIQTLPIDSLKILKQLNFYDLIEHLHTLPFEPALIKLS